MNPSFALLYRIDRSDSRLNLCILEAGANRPRFHTVSPDPAPLPAWFDAQRQSLAEGPVRGGL